ncbi:MAG: ABC transporter ATP-binding protein [Desulfomonilia bacterium]|nr:ABC transporter ATP-binding protein [Desulfomonilia bacterium]
MRDKPILQTRELQKSFRKGPELIHVLKGVTMEVTRGECIAIVGASGSGKSTLLHLLGGLEKPDSGTIRYGDKDICLMNEREISTFRNLKVGLVFQFHYLLSEFSALENVMMPALVSARITPDIPKKARELLDVVGLSDRVTHKPGELSGGEQQRVAIARSLMMSPDILLADEPTGDLDPENGARVRDLFADLKRSLGITMIIVTHNMDLASITERILVLKEGHLEPHVV